MSSVRTITWVELAKHNSEDDLWTCINGKVYDLTSFISEHPGGREVLLQQGGTDGSKSFSSVHPTDVLSSLPPSSFLGNIEAGAPPPQLPTPTPLKAAGRDLVVNTKEDVQYSFVKPPISHMLNLFDFEDVAKRVMKKEAWDYYSSGADDEITLRENHAAFQRVWLKPRVLVNVKSVQTSTNILGYPCSMPVYITATALGKLAHEDGELAIARAAYDQGVHQMIPTLASYKLEEIMQAKQPDQVQFFQLYVNSNRAVTADIIKRAEEGGCKALFVTVDAPQLGRREKDMRNKFTAQKADVQKKNTVQRNQGTARAISAFIDPSFCWDDLAWLKSITKIPICLKGVQTLEDTLKAIEYGVDGVVLSNHGGRQLDCCRSGIEILEEVMDGLRERNLTDKIQVMMDGGIRRGADIFKALALGACAVGIGRPSLYGLASYGKEGVERVLELLKDELIMTMGLMGTPTIKDIQRNMVITRNLRDHVVPVPKDYLGSKVYEPLLPSSRL